ncbi:MAG: J domain-containing protein [bacterium]|nr:J domain-containing protein [bacterium]
MVHTVELSYEDVMTGLEAQVQYSRMGPNGSQELQKAAIEVKRGAHEGMSLRSTGMGNFPPPLSGVRTRNIPGDLHIKYKYKKHEKFRNEGRDLIYEIFVGFDKMATGGKVLVETIEGKKTNLSIPPGTKSGKRFRFKGRGLPELVQKQNAMGFVSHEEVVGDLYALVQVAVPTELNQEQVEYLEKGRELGLFD